MYPVVETTEEVVERVCAHGMSGRGERRINRLVNAIDDWKTISELYFTAVGQQKESEVNVQSPRRKGTLGRLPHGAARRVAEITPGCADIEVVVGRHFLGQKSRERWIRRESQRLPDRLGHGG